MLFFFRLPMGSPPAKGRRTEKAPFTYTHENRRVIDERLYKKKKAGKNTDFFCFLIPFYQSLVLLITFSGSTVSLFMVVIKCRWGASFASKGTVPRVPKS